VICAERIGHECVAKRLETFGLGFFEEKFGLLWDEPQ
jgi:hypothetical protein